MTLEPLSGDLRAFAEDLGAFVTIGPDEERILTDAGPDRATAGPVVPFEVRLVASYQDHLAVIEVANQGFAFPSGDALEERRRARAASSPSGLEGTASGCWRLTVAGRWRRDGRGLRRWACIWVVGRRSRRSVGGAPWVPGRQGLEEAVDRGTPTLVTLGGRWPRRPAAHRLSCGRAGVAPGGSDRRLSLLWARIRRSA
jgi:hypothetical protein